METLELAGDENYDPKRDPVGVTRRLLNQQPPEVSVAMQGQYVEQPGTTLTPSRPLSAAVALRAMGAEHPGVM